MKICELAGNLDEDQLDELDGVLPEEHEQDQDEELIDEWLGMDSEALAELTRDVMPARHMLVKVGVYWSSFVHMCHIRLSCWSMYCTWA